MLGVPCELFAWQAPGTSAEIVSFCSTNYGVTFSLTEKVEVNGPGRHPLFDVRTAVPDQEEKAVDLAWNFEKVLVAPDGSIAGRFRPLVEPESEELLTAIEAVLHD